MHPTIELGAVRPIPRMGGLAARMVLAFVLNVG